ncbi:MAG: hypothetical protein QF531_02415 [Candidatus Poseidonia sp.]|nr:hypothetical protein [Poseidonia sp.]
MLILFLALLVPLSGCTGTGALVGCGDGYSEMHNGDYVETLLSVDTNGKLTVQFESGDYPGFLEESEKYQTDPDIYVTLYVLYEDGTETSASFRQSEWDNFGDGAEGSSWNSLLTFNSPDGFCDDGCEKVKLGTSTEFGALYYAGTCDASPWIDIE